ncbi:DUF6443 domain-containing protein [Chryseobacterium sp. MEBOG07]|uniref:DUF6443 domain-containing protein n=1 Tax=Chryseobacterium sp. MEBOG07 TaxID=2879939 RepID=UPI001F3001E9|nr:DUF6443 domain-containing protein [Chryseobacterium sp. MEBOG07]UKB81345.1 DUF6443 domain-containing protein [Chryseobacterium sp. MEBOG07]
MKKIQLLGLLFTVMVTYAQSTTENFIQSKTCLSGDCSKKIETITYFDGLGRPKQIVSVKSTTTGKDLVTPFTYDGFGRQVKDILPVPANTLNSAIHTGIVNESTANSYYGVVNAYTEKEIENSPLDRVLQLAQPGDPWKMGAGHTQKYKYEVNQGTEVKKFITSTTTSTVGTDNKTISSVSLAPGNGFYDAGILYKNTVTDEDGTPVIQFQNGRGEIVLVRRTDGSQNIDTYYVYNEYGQKAFVIPALAVKKIEQNNNAVSTDILNSLCYQYRYDGLGRQVEKRLPGRDDWESVVYDAANRPVLTQDVNLKNKGQWLLIKYDGFGRVAYTGLIAGGDRAAMQSQIGSQVISESQTDRVGFDKNGLMVYYTNNFLSGFPTLLTVNYYDSYPRDAKEFPPAKILDQFVINPDPTQNGGINTSGLPTASYVKNIEDDNWTKTYFYYNTKGQKVGEKSWNHLGGYTKKEFKLDFSGSVDESYTYHKKGTSDAELVIKERFVYDDQKRLLKHYHQVNTQPEELLVENTYNDLGQLTNKKTGNTTGTPLQSIDQTYNIRGWLTKVNDPLNLNGKLFAYELKYHNPAYSTVSAGKYNGNIAEIDWASADNGIFRRYNYQYDGLDRLKNGIYSEPNATVPQNNYYNESLSYDVNGNIQTLKRNRLLQGLGAQQIDDLSYIYSGNRLNTVSDASGNYAGYPAYVPTAIPYDGNGNMINHQDRGILQIDYNYLNLPNYIKFNKTYVTHDFENTYNVNTKYLYNAGGTKLRKVYTSGTGRAQMEVVNTTDYLDGFQYSNDVLSFVPTSEGYYDFVQNKYIYNYTDQVGNIRLAYYKDASGNLKIDRTTHYYPFGLEFGGDLNISLSISPNYKYSTQGQEKQTETGWSSYRWRNYDPAMGRFFNVDPLSEKYTYQSHYNFSENRVVDARELEGLERISIHTASYAPFDSFGGPLPALTYYGNHWGFRVQGPFAGDGADRKPGTNPNASSKIYGRVDLDLGANSAKDALVNVVARGSHSKDLSSGETTLSEASLTVSLVKDENQVNLDMHLSGNNDLVTLSPDIDVKPSMTIATTSLSGGNKMLHIRGTVSGDHFPANETYITGQNGQGVTLGNSGPLGGKIKGPTTSLPGDNNRPMSQFNKIIYLDKDNNIIQPPKNW